MRFDFNAWKLVPVTESDGVEAWLGSCEAAKELQLLAGPPFVCEECGTERAQAEVKGDVLGYMKAHKCGKEQCGGGGKLPFQGSREAWLSRRQRQQGT